MAFEDVIPVTSRLQVQVEALAAIGAVLALKSSREDAPEELVAALNAVCLAAGVGDLNQLAPPHEATLLSLVRSTLLQAVDLVDNPARGIGWAYTEPAILDGWGRGSAMVPNLIAGAHEDLRDVGSFLDVGTGVGLLALAAANLWPTASVVGIDVWEPSLSRARENVERAEMQERVEIRNQNVVDIADVDRYDCVWVPTFFLTEQVLLDALPKLVAATRPGGWITLGRFAPPPDPLFHAVVSLRTIRAGGCNVDADRAMELLEKVGCASPHVAPRSGPAPLELVIGQRPY